MKQDTKDDVLEAHRSFLGLLLGTAVGDALGLPAEGLSPERIKKLWPEGWRHRLVFGRGMVSDDTEHALLVAQALLAQSRDAERFQRVLAWKLRWWIASLPAGVGFATARACLKLWLGFPPQRSGVRSAGNGPAMRSAIIGAFFAGEPEKRREFVAASTNLTHTDPRAAVAALAVAEAAAWACRSVETHWKVSGPHRIGIRAIRPDVDALLGELRNLPGDEEWRSLVGRMGGSLAAGAGVSEFARSLGLDRGVTGYSYHTVPVALYAWLRHIGDFRAALGSALDCGGDTDTVGSIIGALAGTSCGLDGIPREWIHRIADWPRSIPFMKNVAASLAEAKWTSRSPGPVPCFWPALIPRNLFFLAVILFHGFRRLLPPW
ncbi:MAG: ADP-ribosylglycohydrolase family protein [Planctomycetes bacterium]|nr:ADP-ribosylglycohydrolase family protein [Planctomycetota bacterium]